MRSYSSHTSLLSQNSSDNAGELAHDADDLIYLFNQTFLEQTKTRLIGGANEPLYQPSNPWSDSHCIYFSHDYFASALHEVAHWCIAGAARRKQVDYGYWYQPDGRDPQQQQQFEQVEKKPQALEWIFSCAAGYPFQLSVDNLGGSATASDSFRLGVWHQVKTYCQYGLPERGQQFAAVLKQHFRGPDFINPEQYRLESLK